MPVSWTCSRMLKKVESAYGWCRKQQKPRRSICFFETTYSTFNPQKTTTTLTTTTHLSTTPNPPQKTTTLTTTLHLHLQPTDLHPTELPQHRDIEAVDRRGDQTPAVGEDVLLRVVPPKIDESRKSGRRL